ncbi:MAG: c-type cytochrome [Inquilinaceae bacterium]
MGDPAAGEAAFRQCASCHALEEGRPGAGPHLEGLIGRQVGSVEGFTYSPALMADERAWDTDLLVTYLTDPRGTIPGSRKTYILRNEEVAADIVAYLASLSE